MAIITLDGLVVALGATTAQHRSYLKLFTPQAIGAWTATWNQPGYPGGAAVAASGVAGAVLTKVTPGAFPFTNPTAPALTYLSRFSSAVSSSGVIGLYDRLWENSGLSPTLLTAQTVDSVALTRPDALGADVEVWLQVYTALGAGSTGPTIVYTDQDNNATNTGTLQNFVTTAAAGRSFPFSLAVGDTGVRSIQSYTNGATMTSGTFGLVLRRRIATLAVTTSNTGAALDPLSGGLPTIPDDACLELLYLGSGTSAVTMQGALSLAQG